MSIINHIGHNKKIAIDTSIFIYHFEENPNYVSLTQQILDFIVSHKVSAICSELVLLEILVHPYKNKRNDLVDHYEILLNNFPHLTLQPINRSILRTAAQFRVKYQIKTPDAIHLATAIFNNAEFFIGNDKNLSKVSEIAVINLDQFLENPQHG